MSVKISKISPSKVLNCKIHPVLYKFYLQLRKALGAEIVHRRKRTSNMCIEIIFHSENLLSLEGGHLNTLPEAEQCGYFVICRPQTKRGHTIYKGHRVYQLFLSPVHPKKRRASLPVITPISSASDSFSTSSIG